MGILGHEKTDKVLYDQVKAKFEKGVKCNVIFDKTLIKNATVTFKSSGINFYHAFGVTHGLFSKFLFWEEIREVEPEPQSNREIKIYTRSKGIIIISPKKPISNYILSKVLNDKVASELADRFCPYCMHTPPIIANYCDECGNKLPKWSRLDLREIKSIFNGIEMNVSVGTTEIHTKNIPMKKGHSGLGGALAGGLLLGPVGAVAGAAATRNKKTTYNEVEKNVFVKEISGTSFVKCSYDGIFIQELDITLPWNQMVSCKSNTIEMISGYEFQFGSYTRGIRCLFNVYAPNETNRLKLFKSQIDKNLV